MTRGWMTLVALVLVASAWPLTQVMMDHSAPPRQTMRFSQRELSNWQHSDENSGLTLTWSWMRGPEVDSVPADSIRALGLRCAAQAYDCNMGDGRSGWMVIAIDTLTWRRRIDSIQMSIDSIDRIASQDSGAVRARAGIVSRLEQAAKHESRLVLVAVGRHPGPLLARWSDDAHLILPARITAYQQSWPRDSLHNAPRLYRVHAEPLPQSLYVPNQWAPVLRDTTFDRRQEYNVVIGVGRGWLPRVMEVTR